MSNRNKFLAQYGHEDHIKNTISRDNNEEIQSLYANTGYSKAHHKQVVNSAMISPSVKIKSPHINLEDVDKLFKNLNNEDKIELYASPLMPKKYLDDGMKKNSLSGKDKHINYKIKTNILTHTNDVSHIDLAFNDKDPDISRSVFSHPLTTVDHLDDYMKTNRNNDYNCMFAKERREKLVNDINDRKSNEQSKR